MIIHPDIETHGQSHPKSETEGTSGHTKMDLSPGADPGSDQGGGPDRDSSKLPTVRSSIMRAKRTLFSVGSGARLRVLEALGYFITKYAFSPFWGTFLYYF